jgi:two-component system OmpR family response regulator
MAHILIVDDDPHIRDVIRFALEKAGHTHTMAQDGTGALAQFAAKTVDLVVLDVGLPEMDGLEVCREIRKTSQIPILFLSARDEEIDRILGLEMGGDDYVTKPFSPRELVARVGVILRRMNGRSGNMADERSGEPLKHGSLLLDPMARTACFESVSIELTAIEFNILQAFLTRPRIVFPREQIMQSAYQGNVHVSDRTIDSHVRNIRSKFAQLNCNNVIETVHGVGFRLGPCVAESP